MDWGSFTAGLAAGVLLMLAVNLGVYWWGRNRWPR